MKVTLATTNENNGKRSAAKSAGAVVPPQIKFNTLMKNSNKISLAGAAVFGAVFTLSSFLAIPQATKPVTTTLYVSTVPSAQALAKLNAQACKLGSRELSIQTLRDGYQLSLTGGSVQANTLRLERIANHFAACEVLAAQPQAKPATGNAAAKTTARLALEVKTTLETLAADARRLERDQQQTAARLAEAHAGLRQLERAASEDLANAKTAAQLKSVRAAIALMQAEQATVTRGLKRAHPLVAEYAEQVAALVAQEKSLLGQMSDSRQSRISAAQKEVAFLSHQLESTNARLAAIATEQTKLAARSQTLLAAGRNFASVN